MQLSCIVFTRLLTGVIVVVVLMGNFAASPAHAMPEIPALTKIPPPLASSASWLVVERQQLVVELDQLDQQFAAQTAECTGVPQSDTARVKYCKAQSIRLHKLLAKHIKARSNFNANANLHIHKQSKFADDRGWAYLLDGEYSRAVDKFKEATVYLPDDKPYKTDLAFAESALAQQNGDMKTAVDKCLTASKLAPAEGIEHYVSAIIRKLGAKVKHMGRKFEVRTPAAVCTVRG